MNAASRCPSELLELVFNALNQHFVPFPALDPPVTLSEPQGFSFISASKAPEFAPSLLEGALSNFYNLCLGVHTLLVS